MRDRDERTFDEPNLAREDTHTRTVSGAASHASALAFTEMGEWAWRYGDNAPSPRECAADERSGR